MVYIYDTQTKAQGEIKNTQNPFSNPPPASSPPSIFSEDQQTPVPVHFHRPPDNISSTTNKQPDKKKTPPYYPIQFLRHAKKNKMPPRIPTQSDFTSLPLHTTLHFPSPPESTTTFLILLHGLGDSDVPFAAFARNLCLPGVLCISVRGTSPLAPSLLGLPGGHFHWGDDVRLDPETGHLDADPGFEKAAGLVGEGLVRGVLVDECGWDVADVMVFGFGQGGSLALGLAARLANESVVDVSASDSAKPAGREFKGVVSIGGGLPMSMVSTRSAREKSDTHVLLCQLSADEEHLVRREFKNVTVVRWKRKEVGMPRDREEVLPIMKFFADRLRGRGW